MSKPEDADHSKRKAREKHQVENLERRLGGLKERLANIAARLARIKKMMDEKSEESEH